MRMKINVKPIVVEAVLAVAVCVAVSALLSAQAQTQEGVDSVYIITMDRDRVMPDHTTLPDCDAGLSDLPCVFTLSRYVDYSTCGEYSMGTMHVFYRDVRPYLNENVAKAHIVGRCVGTDGMRPDSKRG